VPYGSSGGAMLVSNCCAGDGVAVDFEAQRGSGCCRRLCSRLRSDRLGAEKLLLLSFKLGYGEHPAVA
jgi:hypothetical protein